MSFNIPIPDTEQAAFAAAAEAAYQAPTASHQGSAEDEEHEMFTAGVSAAELILESGAMGDGPVSATISGHARVGHDPQDGSARDALTVNLVRAS